MLKICRRLYFQNVYYTLLNPVCCICYCNLFIMPAVVTYTKVKDPIWCYILRPLVLKPHVDILDFVQQQSLLKKNVLLTT